LNDELPGPNEMKCWLLAGRGLCIEVLKIGAVIQFFAETQKWEHRSIYHECGFMFTKSKTLLIDMCGSRLHDADEDGTLNVTKKLKRISHARKQRSKSYRTLTE